MGGSFRCGNKAKFSVCLSTYARMALFSRCGSSDDPMRTVLTMKIPI